MSPARRWCRFASAILTNGHQVDQVEQTKADFKTSEAETKNFQVIKYLFCRADPEPCARAEMPRAGADSHLQSAGQVLGPEGPSERTGKVGLKSQCELFL